MPTLSFAVEADYEKVIKMREEISRLESELVRLGESASQTSIDELQNELGNAHKELDKLVQSAAKAGSEFDSTASTLAHVGKEFDVSSTEKQISALNQVISSNELSVKNLTSELEKMKEQSAEAFNSGDMDGFSTLNKEIEEQTNKIQELTAEANNCKNALSVIESNTGSISPQPNVQSIQFYGTKEAYDEMKHLTEEVGRLKKEIAEFDGDNEGFRTLNNQLTETESKLKDTQGAAADAASVLGSELGTRAAESSSRMYELEDAIKKQSAEVEKYSEQLKEAAKELDKVRENGSASEVEAASTRYNALSNTLQNAKNTLRNLNAEQVDAQRNWANTSAEVDKADSALVKLLGGQEKYNVVMSKMPPVVQSAATSITGMTGAAKAFIATPLGAIIAAIVLAVQTLTTWFNSSADGQMEFAKASGYVSGILAQLKETVIAVGEALFKAFKDPQKAVEKLWIAIKENLVNRVQAVGGIFSSLGEIIKSAFDGDLDGAKKGMKELNSQALKLATGVDNAAGKIREYVKGINEAAKASSELSRREQQLHIDRSNWQVKEAELDKKISEARKKMYTGSESERLKATKEAQEYLNEKFEQRIKFAKEEYEIVKGRNALTTNAQEDYDAENKALAEITRLEAERNSQQSMFARREASMEGKLGKGGDKEVEVANNIADALLAIKQRNEDKMLSIQEESLDKQLSLLKNNYRKQIAELDKLQREFAEKNKTAKNKTGDDGLTSEQRNEINKARQLAADELNKGTRDIYGAPLDEYKAYTDKRLDIEKKFNEDIEKLQKARGIAESINNQEEVDKLDRAIANATAKKGESLMQLDFEELQKSPEFVRAFENLKETSTETLQSLINKFEQVKNAAGESFNPEDLREYMNTIQRMTDEITSRNPFAALAKAKKEYRDAKSEEKAAKKNLDTINAGGEVVTGYRTTTDANGDTKIEKQLLSKEKAQERYNKSLDNTKKANANVKSSEKEVSDVVGNLANSIKNVGNSIGGTAGEILNLVGDIMNFSTQCSDAVKATSDASAESISTMEKATIILAIISAALQVAMKIASLFDSTAKEKEKYEDTKKIYESYIAILDQVIDKQLEFAESLSADNAEKSYKKALEYVKDIEESSRNLGKRFLDEGASAGSHSHGYRQYRRIDDKGWQAGAEALGLSVNQFKNIIGSDFKGLFNLSSEQLSKLYREGGMMFVAELGDDVREYTDKIVEAFDKEAEIMEAKIKNATRIDVDTMMSDFEDLLGSFDSDSKDFAANFEKYLKNAIVNGMLKDTYMSQLESWRNKFNEKMQGGMTPEEKDELMREAEEISKSMYDDAQQMKELFGFGDKYSQESSKKGFEAMSQDTADELNGRFTAMYENDLIARASIEENTRSILEVNESLLQLTTTQRDIFNVADETRTIIANSFLELQEIRDNTGKSAGYLKSIQSDISDVKRKIETL